MRKISKVADGADQQQHVRAIDETIDRALLVSKTVAMWGDVKSYQVFTINMRCI